MKKNYLKIGAGQKMKRIISACVIGLAAFNASAQYCGSQASQTGDEEIYNVMVNGAVTPPAYSFSTGCGVTAPGPGSIAYRYSNFMTIGSNYTVTQGVVSTFSVAENECDGPTYYQNGCAAWIDYNQNGNFTDPGEQIYIENGLTVSPRNINSTFIVPFAALTGTTVMRVSVVESSYGVNLTPCLAYGYGETEDYVITVLAGQQCVSTPGPNTIVPTSTLICPVFGTSTMTLATTYTVGGINYQWVQSTGSAFGPWVNANGNYTQTAYTTPTLAGTTWYQLRATCNWGGPTNTLTTVQINVAATTTNTVPYFESFEGITMNDQLPNCSWMTNDSYQCGTQTASISAWRQARTGTKFAEFDASNNVYSQLRYFYSNGIYMNAGVTYSGSVWYATPGNATWTNITLLVGASQTQAGLIPLGSVSNQVNTTYMPISGTFTVPTSGLYYMCVRAQNNGWNTQIVWDDLAVIAPCQFTNNAANIVLTGTNTICAGQSVNIGASGASSYTWSNGPTTNTNLVSPMFNTTYTVTGINPLSGCLGSTTREIVVNQLPPVSIIASKQQVCAGESVNLQAFGANSYTWSAGPAFTSIISVTPSAANNTYTLVGANAYGCLASAVQQIPVNPIPVVTVSGNTLICAGYPANLTATGAGANGDYTWIANNLYLQANPVSVSPTVTTTYMVYGNSSQNCKGVMQFVVAVDPCTGIENINANVSKISVYPNPTNGLFTVATGNNQIKTIEVMDVTGRVVLTSNTANDTTDVNINALANGVYYVKVKTGTASDVVKVVKN